jgi:cytochrome c oxidase subunit 5b
LADPWDTLYGAERFEIAMKAKGFNDPYDSEAVARKAVSSREDPNIVSVETSEDFRIVGCVCTPDTHHVNYIYVHRGETKRCECGEWFKCVDRELPDLSDYGIHMDKAAHH